MLRLAIHRYLLPLAVLLLGALVVPAYGQTSPPPDAVLHSERVARDSEPLQSGPVLTAPVTIQANSYAYLPMIASAPQVDDLLFGSEVDEYKVPVNPRTTFIYGITYLHVRFVVRGGYPLPWRLDWYRNGVYQPDIGSNGTIPTAVYADTYNICYGPGGVCGSFIPRGSYTVKFYLNNQLYREKTAVIQ